MLQSGPCSVALCAAHLTCVRAHKGCWLVRTNLLLHMRGPPDRLALSSHTPAQHICIHSTVCSSSLQAALILQGVSQCEAPCVSALLGVPVLTADCTLGSTGQLRLTASTPHCVHTGQAASSGARLSLRQSPAQSHPPPAHHCCH